MLKKHFVIVFAIVIFGSFLAACSQDESGTSQNEEITATAKSEEQTMVSEPDIDESNSEEANGMLDEAAQSADETITAVKEQAHETMTEIKASAEEKVADVIASASDKPYQVIDGKISQNAVEGWKTYNGGGCGACHGKGAVGSVGPNIGESLVTKMTKEEFIKIVTEGKPGTLMRPNSANKRVMDNIDNLYAYLVARGDGVLGPGNLIKMPLGK